MRCIHFLACLVLLVLLASPAWAISEEELAATRTAAESGDPMAQFNLALAYHMGTWVEADMVEALDWYTRAAEGGLVDAQYNLGFIFEQGEGVPVDLAAATHWYRLAAEQGLAAAQFHLAELYDSGRAGEQNDQEAANWYQMAAQQNYAAAKFNLANMYAAGRGVERDLGEAARLFREAAEQGEIGAHCNLGNLYAEPGALQNDRQALDCYRRGAALGDPNAQFNIGLFYQQGRGVLADPVKALAWFQVAAGNGQAEGAKAAAQLKATLNPTEVAMADSETDTIRRELQN
jgi:TPR repeat protein